MPDSETSLQNALAGSSPAAFAQAASAGFWKPARHLALINDSILDAVRGEGPRVIVVEMPPRHGKSELISHFTPAWFLGRFPDKRVILTSYSDRFAGFWGRQARHTLATLGPRVFGVSVSRASHAANEWQVAGRRGGMTSAGVGGSLTGRGADLLIADDTIKNAEEAISDLVRENQWEWWQSTAWTRLEPGGIAVVVMTRWHEGDLAGRLKRWGEDHGRSVRVLSLPAIAVDDDPLGRKPGEALWPERLPLDELELRRSMLDAYWWSSLYQQKPGSYGKAEWPAAYFDRIWVEPGEWPDAFEGSVIALDPSKGREAKRGDFSATVFVGLARGKLWVDAQVRRRPVPTLCAESVAFAAGHGCDSFGVEVNSFQDLLLGPLEEACAEASIPPLPWASIHNSANKALRISRLGPWLARGKFRIARNRDTEVLVEQLKAFPFGDHDDGPDALEMALRLLRWSRERYANGGDDLDVEAPEEVLRV